MMICTLKRLPDRGEASSTSRKKTATTDGTEHRTEQTMALVAEDMGPPSTSNHNVDPEDSGGRKKRRLRERCSGKKGYTAIKIRNRCNMARTHLKPLPPLGMKAKYAPIGRDASCAC
jgi:hypothetical protein